MQAGDRVGLHGLQATEFNGLMGTVAAPMNGRLLLAPVRGGWVWMIVCDGVAGACAHASTQSDHTWARAQSEAGCPSGSKGPAARQW